MALRNIRVEGDEILTKKTRPVTEFNEKLSALLDDMFETMYEAGGVGLAGPQIGILRSIAVVDVGENPIELINPELLSAKGGDIAVEGCLSVPHVWGEVERPVHIVVKAQDRNGKWRKLTADGFEARAFLHEMEHLEGKLFTSRVIRFVDESELKVDRSDTDE